MIVYLANGEKGSAQSDDPIMLPLQTAWKAVPSPGHLLESLGSNPWCDDVHHLCAGSET